MRITVVQQCMIADALRIAAGVYADDAINVEAEAPHLAEHLRRQERDARQLATDIDNAGRIEVQP